MSHPLDNRSAEAPVNVGLSTRRANRGCQGYAGLSGSDLIGIIIGRLVSYGDLRCCLLDLTPGRLDSSAARFLDLASG